MPHLGAMTVVTQARELKRATEWFGSIDAGTRDVSSLLPEVFDSYARIFHPAWRECDERDLPVRGPAESRTGMAIRTEIDGTVWGEVPWRDIAEANAMTVHAGMQWPSITFGATSQPGLWERAPLHDSLPLRQTALVSSVLKSSTTTPDACWAAVWEGYADMAGFRGQLALPRVAWSGRSMIVASGALDSVPSRAFDDGSGIGPYRFGPAPPSEDYRSPTLWWPDDRGWCVATDVEMDTTYVGGSAGCIDDLLALASLESMRVTARQPITWDSDLPNRRKVD